MKRRLPSNGATVAVADGAVAAGVATVVEDGAATEVAMADGAVMAAASEVGAMEADMETDGTNGGDLVDLLISSCTASTLWVD